MSDTFEAISNILGELAETRAITLLAETAPIPIWIKDYSSGRGIMAYQNRAFCDKFNIINYVGYTDYHAWPKDLAAQYENDDREVLEQMAGVIYTTWLHPRATATMGPHTVAKWAVRDGNRVLIPGLVVPNND